MTTAPEFDLVIRNGTVFDGTGAGGVRADVGIKDGRITALGEASGHASTTIDAGGLAVTPGFIDVHTHDDLAVLTEPDVPFKVMQGVTTNIVGNCGFGVAPFDAAMRMFQLLGPQEPIAPWQDYAGYFERLDSAPSSLNVGVLIGQGTIRNAVMGNENRPPSAAELDAMRSLVREGMAAGALGLSTGLIYEPGRYATTDEIIALAQELGGPEGGLYASHMRNESDRLLDSVEETLRIGREAGVRVQVSHHKAVERQNWGLVAKSLAMMDDARAEGIDVSADQYPYTGSSTSLAAYSQNGSFNLRNGEPRNRPEDVLIASSPAHREREGKRLSEVMQELGKGLHDTVQHIVDEEGRSCTVVLFGMDERDVQTVLAHPNTMVGSDGIPSGGKPHPRLYGTFPRILQRYVRELGVIDFATAVYKMTGMPAAQFRLTDRGTLRPGAWADVVVLDPAEVRETATFEEPRQYPVGIRDVLVNGVPVVRDGAHTGTCPGKALRR